MKKIIKKLMVLLDMRQKMMAEGQSSLRLKITSLGVNEFLLAVYSQHFKWS